MFLGYVHSDVEFNKDRYAETVAVTGFTFSGDQGRKYIECNGFGGDATKFLQQGDLIQFSDTNDKCFSIFRLITSYFISKL